MKSQLARKARFLVVLLMGSILGACASVKDSPPTIPAVLLDRTVYFTNTDGSETIADPGPYDVAPAGESRLRLVPSQPKAALLIPAMPMSFDEDLSSAVALVVPDNESDYHVLLLMPGGKGYDAVGSLTPVRQRGMGSLELAKSKIKDALTRYRTRQQMMEKLEAYPRLPLGKDKWQYQIDGRWMTEQQAIDYLLQEQK